MNIPIQKSTAPKYDNFGNKVEAKVEAAFGVIKRQKGERLSDYDQREMRGLERAITEATSTAHAAIKNLDRAYRDIRSDDSDMAELFVKAISNGITHQGINTAGILSFYRAQLRAYHEDVAKRMGQS